MRSSRCLLYLSFIVLCFIPASALMAQEVEIGRVTPITGSEDEEPIYIPLDELQIGDVVELEYVRLSGNLIPIVALRNMDDDERIVFRYRDTDLDGQLDDTRYELNDEAGAGTYVMQIAADPDFGVETTGDYLVVYTIRRGSTILNEQQYLINEDYETPVIMVTAPQAGETLTLHGEITDETFQVDFLIELSGGTPLQFTVTPDTVSGDLIPLMGITPADEVEFEVAEAENGIASMVYPAPDAERFTAGYYIIAVTREDVDEGDTQGQFELVIAPLSPD